MKKEIAVIYLLVYVIIIGGIYMFALPEEAEKTYKNFPAMAYYFLLLNILGVLYFQIDVLFILIPLLYFWFKDYKMGKINFNYLLLTWVAIFPLKFFIKLSHNEILYSRGFYEHIIFQAAIWIKILITVIITIFSLYKLTRQGFSAKI